MIEIVRDGVVDLGERLNARCSFFKDPDNVEPEACLEDSALLTGREFKHNILELLNHDTARKPAEIATVSLAIGVLVCDGPEVLARAKPRFDALHLSQGRLAFRRPLTVFDNLQCTYPFGRMELRPVRFVVEVDF